MSKTLVKLIALYRCYDTSSNIGLPCYVTNTGKKKFVSLIPVGRSYTLELSSGQQQALLAADNTKVLTV